MATTTSSSIPTSANPDSVTNHTTIDQYDNPFFLHSSDHAGLILVSDRLSSGADFHSWRRSVRMALNVRNKLGFIDGTISKPSETHRAYGSWSRCNDMVATWIMNSVSKKIGQSLLFISTAEGIWQNLLTRFKQDEAPRVYEIEQRLSNIQQGSLDVTAYYTELVTLWEEYRNYVELPVCTCGKCECNAAALWEKLQQRSRVTKFLMGLNESFESTRRQILMIKPIPSIESVFHMVTQDEGQRSIRPVQKVDNVVFQATTNSASPMDITSQQSLYDNPYNNVAYAVQNQGYRPRSNRPVCTHCGRMGHVIQKCFKLHGFPPGYIPGFKTGQSNFQNQQRSSAPFPQPRGPSFPQAVRPQSHVVANVVNDSFPYPSPAVENGINLNQMSQDQLQSLLQKITAHVKAPEPPALSPKPASITDHGTMAVQSSCGGYSGLDDW